jgi:hypothetical protein
LGGLLDAVLEGVFRSRELMQLSALEGKHDGETAFVIGSGKTLDYYEPAFFEDKLTIAVNFGWSFKLEWVNYMVTKYHDKARNWVESGRVGTMVVTRGLRGHRNLQPLTDERMIVVDHNENTVERWDGDWPDEGLVATHSSITTAMHLAAFMGVRWIVTVGADCGTLDGLTNIDGYQPEKIPLQPARFPSFEKQNRIVANILRERYGVGVMSMLPFVTANMEGHKFVSEFGSLNT